jgi:hypothetical protein
MYNAEINQYSWVNLTNVLWVEYPLGLGFSTTDNVTAMGEEETAADFVGFFHNFLDTFDIKNYNVYVTGESYAGRYVPYVSAALIDEEAKGANYNVSGALMYDPVIGQVCCLLTHNNRTTLTNQVRIHWTNHRDCAIYQGKSCIVQLQQDFHCAAGASTCRLWLCGISRNVHAVPSSRTSARA